MNNVPQSELEPKIGICIIGVSNIGRRAGCGRPLFDRCPMDWVLEIILRRLVKEGALTVTTAGGQKRDYGDGAGPPVAARFTSYSWQWAVLLDPELRLGEAYMEGGLVLDRGSIAELHDIAARNFARQEPTAWTKWVRKIRTLVRFFFELNNLIRARHNSKHHYDIDSRIYKLFLDPNMQYSCAYFETAATNLDDAQRAKIRHIERKLLLDKPDLRVL